MSAGRDIPDRVVRSMDVWPHLAVYATAFWRLSARRDWLSGGMGPAAPLGIKEQEKESYARGRGLARTDEEYERFLLFVDAQDDEYLRWHGEESAKRNDSTAPTAEELSDDETDTLE